jgi:glycosidase
MPHAISDKILAQTTEAEIETVRALCRNIAQSDTDAEKLFSIFYESASETETAIPADVKAFHASIAKDWHQRAPIYYTYPHTVADSKNERGSLHDTARLIKHAQALGAGSLYVLPVFESPDGDGGFDVRSWDIRESLGGDSALGELMSAAMAAKFPVIIDLPFNHLSIEHDWVKRLQEGDLSYAQRFLPVPDDWVKTGEKEIDGRTFAVYKDSAGRETERWIIFPHAARDHAVNIETSKKRLRLYHTFYPFQLDVNLRSPDVFQENLGVIRKLLCAGVLGFRLDAVHHWLKRDETRAEGLPETFDYVQLLNLFTKLVGPASKLFPEVGADSKSAAKYLGKTTRLKRAGDVPSHTDGFWGFESRAAIPEAVFRRTADPFWAMVERTPVDLPRGASILSMVSHHDELPGQFLMDRESTVSGMLEHGGVPFRDGTSVSGRLAPLLENNFARLILAYGLMFLLPSSTPTLYYGEEAGLGNDEGHADREAEKRKDVLSALGAGQWGESYDARDVHRQYIALETLESAVKTPHPVAEAFRQLSALREQIPAMGREGRVRRISVPYESVLLMERSAPVGPKLFAAANLGVKAREVNLSELDFKKELLFESSGPFERKEGRVLVLPPESFFIAEIVPPK